MSLPNRTSPSSVLSKTGSPSAIPITGDAPQLEEDLVALLEEQAERLRKRRRGANWVIVAFFGLLFTSASAWYVSSENNQRKVADLILDFKSSGKDFKMIANPTGIADQYDKALEEIGSRSKDIDQASASLGVDPTTVVEDGMEAEMKEMAGGEGRTVGERNRLLKAKLGVFADAQVKAEQRKQAEKAKVAASVPATPRKKVAPAPAVVPVVHEEPLIIR